MRAKGFTQGMWNLCEFEKVQCGCFEHFWELTLGWWWLWSKTSLQIDTMFQCLVLYLIYLRQAVRIYHSKKPLSRRCIFKIIEVLNKVGREPIIIVKLVALSHENIWGNRTPGPDSAYMLDNRWGSGADLPLGLRSQATVTFASSSNLFD